MHVLRIFNATSRSIATSRVRRRDSSSNKGGKAFGAFAYSQPWRNHSHNRPSQSPCRHPPSLRHLGLSNRRPPPNPNLPLRCPQTNVPDYLQRPRRNHSRHITLPMLKALVQRELPHQVTLRPAPPRLLSLQAYRFLPLRQPHLLLRVPRHPPLSRCQPIRYPCRQRLPFQLTATHLALAFPTPVHMSRQ